MIKDAIPIKWLRDELTSIMEKHGEEITVCISSDKSSLHVATGVEYGTFAFPVSGSSVGTPEAVVVVMHRPIAQ